MRAWRTVLFVVAACTHRHHIVDVPTGASVTVERIDGSEVEGRLADHPTQVVFVDKRGHIIPTERIARVVDIDRGRGAFEGATIVGVAATAVGAAIGYADGDDKCGEICVSSCSELCILTFTAREKAAMTGALFGMVGAGAGAIIGAVIGSRDVYLFGDSYQARITPSGPAGSVAGATIQF